MIGTSRGLPIGLDKPHKMIYSEFWQLKTQKQRTSIHDDEDDDEEDQTGAAGSSQPLLSNVKRGNTSKLKGVMNFSGTHSVSGIDNLTPFQIFQKFFPDEIYQYIATQTNKYASEMKEVMLPLSPNSRFHKWKDVSSAEIKAFISVEIAMGMIHKPTLESYFSDVFFLVPHQAFHVCLV